MIKRLPPLLLAIPALAQAGPALQPAWQEAFDDASASGVLVICRENSQYCQTNDPVRAAKRFLPASTFKIPNALIALETGALQGEHQIFKWDGVPRAMAEWNRDFNLRGAMQASVVPVFQQFARDIGPEKMRSHLAAFAYGNQDVGGGQDRFWLDGALRISALEQIAFLEKLYHNRLPVSRASQLAVKDAMVYEANGQTLIRAKTGYGAGVTPKVGWWVGWVEKGTQVSFFALNMDIIDEAQLPLRKEIVLRVLAEGGGL